METFSIIIPTYNSAKTLKYCLDSIESQTFPNFEILIMDGASSDSTLEIANQYHDERIRIYSEIDKGIYDAMNKGIAISKGEWIYFLGSDDKLLNNYVLERVNEGLENNFYDVVYGDITSTRFNGIYGGQFDAIRIYNQNICHQAIFFSRTVFEKIGKFNIRFKAHADWEHNFRWLLSGKIKTTYVNLVIAEYADGGYSSRNSDLVFENEKMLTYLTNVRKNISLKRRLRLLFNEFEKINIRNNKKLFVKYVILTPQIILGV